MQNLFPQQAQALWDAGGFIVLPDLPEGSEYGLDGTYHTIRQSFTGSKFVPPGLHLVTISPAAKTGNTAGSGPGAIPLRSGILVHLRPRERLILSYDPKTESLTSNRTSTDDKDVTSIISDDHLRALDPGLASYPFEGLEGWKNLTSAISEVVLAQVLGDRGAAVDGMRGVEGDEEDLAGVGGSSGSNGTSDAKMRFAQFDLRRSWGDGVVGEDLTRHFRDKSWLLGKVISGLGGDPLILLAHLQLAFFLLLHLSSPATLTVYKRILSLIARSADIHLHPLDHSTARRVRACRTLYLEVTSTLVAQITALPEGVFDTELPELDVWFNEELDSLRVNLSRGLGVPGGLWVDDGDVIGVKERWENLRAAARRKFGWHIDSLKTGRGGTKEEEDDEDEEEEEEGEYAPVIVEM